MWGGFSGNVQLLDAQSSDVIRRYTGYASTSVVRRITYKNGVVLGFVWMEAESLKMWDDMSTGDLVRSMRGLDGGSCMLVVGDDVFVGYSAIPLLWMPPNITRLSLTSNAVQSAWAIHYLLFMEFGDSVIQRVSVWRG